MKYITFVPLIGGMAIANANATNGKPYCVLSYPCFAKNESNLKNYWPDVPWYLLDPETNTLNANVDFDDVDFVSSVCPCAGMSMLNTATRSADNATNNWLYKVCEFTLNTIKPKVYWGENAPGLYSEQNSKVLETLRDFGERYGYSFTIYKTDTYLHGIPQHRVRTFFFFWKDSTCPILPWVKSDVKPFEEFILEHNNGTQQDHFIGGDPARIYPEMKWIMETRCNNSYNEYVKFFYDQIDKYNIRTPYAYIEHDDCWDEYRDWLSKQDCKDKPINENGKRTPWYYINYRKEKVDNGKGYFAMQPLVYKGAANAIISKNMHWTLHPTEQRFLNTREILSMMGMPSDFELISNNLQHVTQNVPVKTATDITNMVIDFINGKARMSNASFIMQDNTSRKITNIDDPKLFNVKDFC